MNYYEILGVEKTATKEDIKRAFKKLVVKYHPDKNADNPQANEFFLLINEAYQILSDNNKRANYDYTPINKTAFKTQEESNKNTTNSSYSSYQEYKKPKNQQALAILFVLGAIFYCIISIIASKSDTRPESKLKLKLKSKSQEKELSHFRNIITEETEPHKNKVLLKQMGVIIQHDLGSQSEDKDETVIFFGIARYIKDEHKAEYLFLLAVLEYKAGKKELALKHLEMAKTRYKEADWYYYVGILQTEIDKDKSNACTNLKIAAEMGDTKAKVALISHCQ